MVTAAPVRDTVGLLESNPVKKELVETLRDLKTLSGKLSHEQVLTILGQWFHPLHYFPVFLSRLISVAPTLEMQTFISRILWQELGEGDPHNAHEAIYVETMREAGFSEEDVTGAAPFDATRELLRGYREASADHLEGLGFMYGTEVVDLEMVSAIGKLMRHCTGMRNIPWVNIHVAQEPGHVESSGMTLQASFDEEEQERVVRGAERMWTLWVNFFKNIKAEIVA